MVYGWSTSSNPMTLRRPPSYRSPCRNVVVVTLHASSDDKKEEEGSTTANNKNIWDYDLAVVGGGVVGVQAALAAASGIYSKRRVVLIDSMREGGVLMAGEEDLSIGAPTGLFSKALRDTSKRIKVSTLRGMGLREDRYDTLRGNEYMKTK